MRWVQSAPGDFRGVPPSPRSGHSAVKVGKSYMLVFGGLVDKKFLNDLTVYDMENKVWFQPTCTGSASDGENAGPSPRAFHVAVAIDCHMFIFGGRSGRDRLGDFWMLDTDIWQWAELTGFGDIPSARDFSAGASIGNGKIVIYGGWDGSKWLSDVYILDTISLEWRQLPVVGPSPPPRCAHTATMVEKRLLILGGRGSGGTITGDLWALKGLFEEDSPAWTQLKLPGQAPAPRCGHSVTAGGHQLLVFGGHGTGGWLTRYDIYHNDCVILDRASVQWKRLALNSESPPPRAYHSMTRIGTQFLLIGGYDGKTTFSDFWWLVSEDDPMAKRALHSPQKSLASMPPAPQKPLNSSSHPEVATRDNMAIEEGLMSPLAKLRRHIGLPPISVSPDAFDFKAINEQAEKQLISLGLSLVTDQSPSDRNSVVKIVRKHWNECNPKSIQLKELGPLLHDYQQLVTSRHEKYWVDSNSDSNIENATYRFFHLKSARQLRIDDIPQLLAEYKELLHSQSQL